MGTSSFPSFTSCSESSGSHQQTNNVPRLNSEQPFNPKSFTMRAIAAQCFACVSANLVGFVAGTILGWPTPIIPLLQAADSTNVMSSDQIGWIASVLGVGAAIGPITTWLTLDRIGRKSTVIVSVIPMIVSYALMAIQTEYHFLLIGRCLAGLGVGAFMSSAPLYIGEVADNKVRGAMGVLGVICMNCGSLFVYILGPFVTVSELNMTCGCVATGLTMLLFFIPESPYYHLIHGDVASARISLTWLRRSDNVSEELTTMTTYVERKKLQSSKAFDLVTTRGNRRAMTILVIIQTIQPFSGSLAIPAYSYSIFEDSGYEMSPHTLVVTMGTVALLSSLAGIFSVDRFGRRPVLLFGTSAMTVSLIALGTFYTLQSRHHDVSSITWLPFVAVMTYAISHSAGLHSLPSILLSEYFSTNVKAKAAMIFTILLSIGGSLSIKFFQLSYDDLGLGTTFFFCCSLLVGGTMILAFIMPETKGCSFQNIEHMHSGEKIDENIIPVERAKC